MPYSLPEVSIEGAMATQPKHFISVEEFLEAEEKASERHEYLDGEIFTIVGASANHSLIAANIVIHIGRQLLNTPCRTRGSDMMIRTSPSGLYSYADAVVSCLPEHLEKNMLLNPIIIVEVLSPNTQDYDRGEKFQRYRSIPSFREYLIVAQDRVYVEHHIREGSEENLIWSMRERTKLEDVISLNSVNATIPLSAVYSGVSFENI